MSTVNPTSIYVPDSRYGRRKAKQHAQAEANRLGRKVLLQFDTYPARDGELWASVACGWLPCRNAPFFTYYPEVV